MTHVSRVSLHFSRVESVVLLFFSALHHIKAVKGREKKIMGQI